MELFIALFGGLYLLIRCLNDKVSTSQYRKRADEERKNKEIESDMWVSTVVDDELEARCRNAAWRFAREEDRVKELLLEEVEDDIKSVFDRIPIEIKKLVRNDADLALIALMVMFGKLPYKVATEGVLCIPYNAVRENFKKDEERWWEKREFFILVDKLLKEKIPEHKYRPLCCTYCVYKGDSQYNPRNGSLRNIFELQDPKELNRVLRVVYYWKPAKDLARLQMYK